MRAVLGLDVGGANLKAAHAQGTARLRPFALWKAPQHLAGELRALLRDFPDQGTIAVTMTGELCDCFETKRQGVHAILDAVAEAAGSRPVLVWRTDGRLVDMEQARATPLQVAAANWLALAVYAGRHAPHGSGLLVDVGSTTTDVIPLSGGRPVPRGLTDAARLQSSELVYTGARRTPVAALVHEGVAAELFATTLDVYLTLGDLAEDSATDTADGRPATRPWAHARLARMLGGDAETCPAALTRVLAERVATIQLSLIRKALLHVASGPEGPLQTVVLAGSGEFLARKAVEQLPGFCGSVVSMEEQLGPELSSAACAYALAVLASEQQHG